MTEIDIEKMLIQSVKQGIAEGVKSRLSGYSSPLDDIIKSILSKHDGEFRKLLESAIASSVNDDDTPPEQQLAFDRGKDENGKFYRGVCVVASRDNYQFAIVSPNRMSLEFAWNRTMAIPMDSSKIQHVRIYEDRKDGES